MKQVRDTGVVNLSDKLITPRVVVGSKGIQQGAGRNS